MFGRVVYALQTPAQRTKTAFKRVARDWVFVDGSSVDGPFLSASKQWVVVLNNWWWAARQADFLDKRLGQSSHTVMEPLLIKLASRWADQPSSVLDPSDRIAFDKTKLLAWARTGRLHRCESCDRFCEDLNDPSEQYVKSAYRSIAKILPWGVRVNRDVMSAMLSTVPEGVKVLWGIMTPIPNTSGLANITFMDPNARWCGQMYTHLIRWCDSIHGVNSDCKTCGVSDAELWRASRDGLC